MSNASLFKAIFWLFWSLTAFVAGAYATEKPEDPDTVYVLRVSSIGAAVFGILWFVTANLNVSFK